MSLPTLISKLRETYPTAERDGFTFTSIDSALSIHIEGTDVHTSLRGQSSNKDQIDLTYGATLPDGMSPVDDFFPTVVRPKHLPQSRHLKIPCRVWGECLTERKQEWVADQNDVVRLDRNEGRNPSLQLRGIDTLRRLIPEGDWIVFVHQSGQSSYEVFSLKGDQWINPSGRSKEVLFERDARASRIDFRLEDIDTPPVAGTQLGLLSKLVGAFIAQAQDEANLHVDSPTITRIAGSLLSKRFLILTGLAGSGKTKLAQAFARWITPDPEWIDESDRVKGKNIDPFYALVPVGADWTGNENIVGYPNGLEKTGYFTKPALDLILHAGTHEDIPHFLILDEMNLSHVERYFADMLSMIESEEAITLYCDRKGPDGNPENTRGLEPMLKLPKNLFVIGTVNVDETTYMFSPKVLDRANVIEFRMEAAEMEGFLEKSFKPELEELDGNGAAAFGKAFVDAAKMPVTVPADVKTAYDAEILLFFKTLQEHGAEFGYRTAYETARFIRFYKLLGNHPDGDSKMLPGAFDCVVVQKFLPKLNGSESKLRGLLWALAHLCSESREWDADKEKRTKQIEVWAKEAIDKGKSKSSDDSPSGILEKKFGGDPKAAPYALSFEKIERMWRAVKANGFTSFAES